MLRTFHSLSTFSTEFTLTAKFFLCFRFTLLVCKCKRTLVMQFSPSQGENTLPLWKMREKCESKQSKAHHDKCAVRRQAFLLYSNLIKSFDHDIVGFEFNSNELHVHHIKHTHKERDPCEIRRLFCNGVNQKLSTSIYVTRCLLLVCHFPSRATMRKRNQSDWTRAFSTSWQKKNVEN